MQMFFKTRQEARNHKAGKIVDNGTSSENGRRWGRKLSLNCRHLAVVKVETLKGYDSKRHTLVSYKRAFNV